MAKTAKERIEEEIKDVNRSLVYSLNKYGRDFNSGKRQGLTIALAHVENAENTESELMDVIRNYGIDNQKLEKKLATAVEALEKISEVQNLNPFGKDFDVTKAVNKAIVMRGTASQALAEIGGEDE